MTIKFQTYHQNEVHDTPLFLQAVCLSFSIDAIHLELMSQYANLRL